MSLARFVVWAPRRSSVTLMIKKVGETHAGQGGDEQGRGRMVVSG